MNAMTSPTEVNTHKAAARSMTLPRILLNLEGLALFISTILLYAYFQGSGLLFIALLFVPDIAAIGYLHSPRVGSWIYNAVHTTATPLLLAVIAFVSGQTTVVLLALIWLAHIGMDRTLSYGLKYPEAFKSTHLQKV